MKQFPFLLNNFAVFEYYITILGILTLRSRQPYEFQIKKEFVNKDNYIELSSEKVN
jgi:hypothetical protein